MAECRLTPAAERDLEAIWRHTVQQWGVMQANRYTDHISAAFDDLAQSPEMALKCDHIRPGYRRWPVERHMIYFCTTEYGILVVRILHDHMDAERHL
jgi:toxin ParE1/3/4